MLEEKLNIIIESIELQNRLSPETDKPAKEIDSVKISVEELQILSDIFADIFPEEMKSFADALSRSLMDFNNPEPSIPGKKEKEAEIIELFERNKSSIAYLNSFNRVLIATEYDRNLLKERNRSHNFPVYPGRDYRPVDQYIEKLAEVYVQGNNTSTIQYLLKTKNNTFLESIDFIEDLKTAMQQTERERLKKKMQSLDELEILDLPELEIRAGATLTERKRMKEIMQRLDVEENNEEIKITEAEGFPGHKNTIAPAKIVPIEKSRHAWIKYAVAASVIGIIALTTTIIFNNRKTSSDIVRNKPDISDTTRNKPDKDQNKNDALASNKLDSFEIVMTVRKEGAMGFAVKPEKIRARIYRVEEKISERTEIKSQIDSLKKLDKTYTFKNNNLVIYLANRDQPELYKIDGKYYLKITDTSYHIRPSDKPVQANRVTDRNILDRIDKINYQKDNK